MKARALLLVPALAAALQYAACHPEGAPAAGGAGGDRGTPAGGTNAGSGGSGRPDAGGPSGRACGGPVVMPCPADQYCLFNEHGMCGVEGAGGVCRPRPVKCAQHCEGACGCDGELYCSVCMASAAGADVAGGLRPCGGIETCADVAVAIAGRVGGGDVCTTVVRLDYLTRVLKSARIQCAQATNVTAAAARQTAERITGFGEGAQLVSGLAPPDELVFWEAPSESGGVAAVSARTGRVVFGGSILWNAAGEVIYPIVFNHPAALGPTCGSAAQRPPARGLDLTTLDELPAAEVDAALDALWASALPDGLALGAAMLDALVLLYPPQVGAFDPEAAEWVVMLNSGAAP